MLEKTQFFGDSPLARFGHTITPIGKDKAILFGGAVGDTGKYVITGDTFVCDYHLKKWKKLQCRGMPPSNRAAHYSVAVDHYLFVYGGALGGGQLADDNLYQLDFLSLQDKAYWGVKNCNGASPGARYGHVMAYMKPFLILHGGNTGSEPVSDLWSIDILSTTPVWKKVDPGPLNPPARVYHSASICKTGTANGMMVIFGGRGVDQSPLNDTWGLRKHRDGRLDWMQAPYKNSQPADRYQHNTLFVGTLLMIIGGRNNQVGDAMSLDVYDTDSSDWYRLPAIQRFRHACFLDQGFVYIHGGFDQVTPSVPTDDISKIDLKKLFAKFPALYKSLAFELGDGVFLNHSPNINTTSNNNPINSTANTVSSQRGNRRENNRESVNDKERNSYTGSYNKREKMDIEYHPKKGLKNSKCIRLCPEAVVANFDQQSEIKKIQIDQLPTQNRRLISNITLSSSKETHEKTYRFFLNNLFCRPTAHIGYPIPSQYVDRLLEGIERIVQQQPTLIKLRAPVKIFGDIHGQIQQLNRFFEAFGPPSDQMPNGDIEFTNYLFLGDYVDRGTKSVQTLLLLFSLKLKYPDSVLLLRGSHQDRFINRSMGFGDECATKFKENIDDTDSFFNRCNRIFERLPLAALIDDDIFCVHGGIGATLKSINDIDQIQRPLKVSHDPKSKTEKIVYQLLWTDPCRSNESDFTSNSDHDYFKTNINFKFSQERANSFCVDNDLLTIVRSHEPVLNGFESSDSLMTIFSASDYGGMGNKSGIIHAKKNSEIAPKILNPVSTRERWISSQQLRKKSHEVNSDDGMLRNVGFTPVKNR